MANNENTDQNFLQEQSHLGLIFAQELAGA